MAKSALVPARSTALRKMSLRECPDLLTAIAAGEAHGLTSAEALKSAFGKWLIENADDVERYKLAHFYAGKKANRAMVNNTALLRFVTVMLVEQGKALATLREEVRTLRTPPKRIRSTRG